MRINSLIKSIAFCLCVFFSAVSLNAESFKISVRTIQAGKGPAFVDSSIKDLSSWFEELPFESFKLKESKRVVVNSGKEKKLKFLDKQQLMLKVLYMNSDKTGLNLVWHDQDKQELLNSQIHLSPREPLVIGLDQGKKRCLLLAVKVLS